MSTANETDIENPTIFFKLGLQIYTSFLLIIGLPGNAISGYIMATDQTNRITTRILMVIIAAADTAVLLTGVTRYWSNEVLGFDFRNYSDLICKVHVFAFAFFTDFAVGSLCAVAVERFLVVAFPHHANTFTSIKSVCFGMATFAFVLSIKNGIHLFMMGLLEITGASDETFHACKTIAKYHKFMEVFKKIDFITFAVIPYIILFSCNLYIYCKLKRQRRLLQTTINKRQTKINKSILLASSPTPGTYTNTDNMESEVADKNSELMPNSMIDGEKRNHSKNVSSRQERRKRKPEDVIKVLTALTVVHVVCTLPGTILTLVSDYKHLSVPIEIKQFLVIFIFTNNAINFFAYLASSERFRKKLARILCCDWKNQH
ncbi:unnamed protein product [Rodentolepis nana]|uniref:G_PROTEIN_RECEP_F1_2 domain-containing protein n=1 Tax=Rodentolepis nana TaxID=102285 RepID=A0A0R3TMN5_RODNA|nr:unnamed protein product [Rodentolepis nana]